MQDKNTKRIHLHKNKPIYWACCGIVPRIPPHFKTPVNTHKSQCLRGFSAFWGKLRVTPKNPVRIQNKDTERIHRRVFGRSNRFVEGSGRIRGRMARRPCRTRSGRRVRTRTAARAGAFGGTARPRATGSGGEGRRERARNPSIRHALRRAVAPGRAAGAGRRGETGGGVTGARPLLLDAERAGSKRGRLVPREVRQGGCGGGRGRWGRGCPEPPGRGRSAAAKGPCVRSLPFGACRPALRRILAAFAGPLRAGWLNLGGRVG